MCSRIQYNAQGINLLPGLILLMLLRSYNTATIHAPTQACNCIRLKDCAPYTTLLHEHQRPSSGRDAVQEIVHNAGCGYLGLDQLACCPTELRLPTRSLRTVRTTEKYPWVWDSRAFEAGVGTHPITNRFATLNDNLYVKSNVIDYEDPQTFLNCPHAFYETENLEPNTQILRQRWRQLGHQHPQIKYNTGHSQFDSGDDYFDRALDYPGEHADHEHHGDGEHFLHHHHVHNVEQKKIQSPIIFPDNKRFIRPTIATTSSSKLAPKLIRGPSTPRSASRHDTAGTTSSTRNIKKSPINSPHCGVSVGTRITGGMESQGGQFPWITRIGYLNTTSNRISYRCSGSVISEQYVLTAAHCVTNLVSSLVIYHVLIGDMEITPSCRRNKASCNTRQTFDILNITIHANYGRPKFANDIALLRIARPDNGGVTYGTICLPLTNSASLSNELTGKTGIVAGWSTNNEGVEISTSPSVKYLRLPIVNTTECAINYAKYSENFKDPIVITPSQLCAQGQPMNDVCKGDSGGPFMDDGSSGLLNASGRYTLLGIVAFGPNICGASNFPGVYTRVSSYVDWILGSIS